MGAGCRDPAFVFASRVDECAAFAHEFAPDVRERRADGRRDLDHRGLKFRLDVVAERPLRRVQQPHLARGERPRRGVDDLVFFLDAEREGLDPNRHHRL